MRPILLVHGGCHDARCWGAVTERLPAQAVDLPASGLAGVVDTIVEAIDAAPQPVLLVAHSLGGMAISAAAEARPARVARLVYVAALLPIDGESAATIPHSKPLGAQAATVSADDGRSVAIDPAQAVPIFYHDCPPEVAAQALACLRTTDVRQISDRVALTSRFGSVPKTYVACLRDRAIDVSAQLAMATRYPTIELRTCDTGHSPFLSHPDAFAALLAELAQR